MIETSGNEREERERKERGGEREEREGEKEGERGEREGREGGREREIYNPFQHLPTRTEGNHFEQMICMSDFNDNFLYIS